MPKFSKPLKSKLYGYVSEFGSHVFSTDGAVLLCKVCEKTVNHEKKYFINQHLSTTKHISALASKSGEKKTTLLSTAFATSSKKSQFSLDLCKTLIDAGIPFWKLENQSLKNFLQKYTGECVPSESALRKNYLPVCYENTIQRIRNEVDGKKIWISIDETTDSRKKHIANVIIGVMEPVEATAVKVFLLSSEELEKANSTTIAQFFTNSLNLLWPGGVKHNDVLLFLSDAAPYMKKAGDTLKVLFPQMIHLTCLAHGFHRISEEIRSSFPDVDKLISSIKNFFLKAPSRIQLFKTLAPGLALPPEPVLTRWGTWISAALYYAKNFEKLSEVVAALSEDEAASIRDAKILLNNLNVRNSLSYIAVHYANLPETITKLEKRGESLVTAMNIVEETVRQLESVPGEVGSAISEKCKRVMSANTGLVEIKQICEIIKGDTTIVSNRNPSTLSCFKYASITSTEVERSFSVMKNILSDRRLSMTQEHLQQYLVVMCNQ